MISYRSAMRLTPDMYEKISKRAGGLPPSWDYYSKSGGDTKFWHQIMLSAIEVMEENGYTITKTTGKGSELKH